MQRALQIRGAAAAERGAQQLLDAAFARIDAAAHVAASYYGTAELLQRVKDELGEDAVAVAAPLPLDATARELMYGECAQAPAARLQRELELEVRRYLAVADEFAEFVAANPPFETEFTTARVQEISAQAEQAEQQAAEVRARMARQQAADAAAQLAGVEALYAGVEEARLSVKALDTRARRALEMHRDDEARTAGLQEGARKFLQILDA